MLPFENIILIDREQKIPVYKQIALAIISAIQNGTMKAGMHLPGSRELSRMLRVHRKTVIAAYDEMEAQDWIVIEPRKYAAVSERIPMLKAQKWNTPVSLTAYNHDFYIPFRQVEIQTNSANSATVPDIIIDDGHPDVRLSPIDELLKTYRSLTSRKSAIKNAHIGTEQGAMKLRQEMALYLSETRGLNISASHILITHGAQMSIYLVAQLLLNASASIIVAKPNYPVANRTFEQTGANVIEVDVDEYGIDTDAIELLCLKQKIDAVYVISHHHYPTTVTLSVERRMKLLELSRQFGFALIEDDYDFDYHYTSSPYLPLASGHHNGALIYIGSFSKILDPSLRIGFMVAPQNFINQCVALRKIIDVGGDGYMQNALATLIGNGELRRHLKKAKKIYHQRRDFLDKLLKEKLKTFISYTLPSGGMAIWIKLLPEHAVGKLTDSTKLKIMRVDVEQNAFRFGFASLNEEELQEAVCHLEERLLH